MIIRLRRLLSDEGAQALPVVVLMMGGIMAVGAAALDVGHCVYTQRDLQAVTDADALAAAQSMSKPTATPAAVNGAPINTTGSGGVVATYSAVTGENNARTSLPNVSVSSQLECLNTLKAEGIPCAGSVPYNAIKVTQTMTLSTFFGAFIGHKTMPISATSTASARGGSPRPTNVAVVMDTTLSMNAYDTNCSNTQMQCALNGFQVLLKSLQPCGNYQTSCNPVNGVAVNSFDRVALFTFPNVTLGTAYLDTNCTTPVQTSISDAFSDPTYGTLTMQTTSSGSPVWKTIPTAVAYSFPSATASSYSPTGASTATYQITQFLSDYRTSDSATSLNTSSTLVQAAGAVPNCGGMGPPNFDGDYGTYYAGAIYAAQAALTYEQTQFPGSENVMIILGDGDSHAPQNWWYANPNSVSSTLSLLNFALPGTLPTLPSPANNSGTYPSYVNECNQAVTAAQAATATGTLVYTVAYGSSAISGCGTDTASSPYLNNPCDAMAAIASAPQMFYSDWQQTGSDGTCVSSQPYVSLNSIFAAISTDLTTARLIPNNTT